MFWILSSLELGTWIGWALAKFGRRSQVQEVLINGAHGARAFGFVDGRLAYQTRTASPMQRKAAAGIVRGLRFFAGTRACELAILKVLQDKWPGAKSISTEVKLHV